MASKAPEVSEMEEHPLFKGFERRRYFAFSVALRLLKVLEHGRIQGIYWPGGGESRRRRTAGRDCRQAAIIAAMDGG
jgi:hypothetical protein